MGLLQSETVAADTPLARTSTYDYDPRRNLKGATNGAGLVTQYFHNELNQRMKTVVGGHTGELMTTTYSYDEYRTGGSADWDLWNNAHTATLEDYGLHELDAFGNRVLYHPDVWPLLPR